MNVSSWNHLVVSNIKLACLSGFLVHPKTWDAFSAQIDVFEWNIQAKEALNEKNQNKIVNKKLDIFVDLVPVELENNDERILQKYNNCCYNEVVTGLLGCEYIPLVLASKLGKCFHP